MDRLIVRWKPACNFKNRNESFGGLLEPQLWLGFEWARDTNAGAHALAVISCTVAPTSALSLLVKR